jgi:hypothetical protein
MNVTLRRHAVVRRALLSVALLLGVVVPGVAIAGASGQPPGTSAVTVSEILSTTATLSGVPDPQGQLTLAWFEYGTTSAYGSRTPGQNLGSGTAPVPVSASLSGLEPDTTYHVRLDVQSASVTVDGPDTSFTTSAAPATTTLPAAPAPGQLVGMKVLDDRKGVFLGGVSCTRPASCWAVGDYNGGLLVDRDQAGVWAPTSVPSPGPGADLMGIDCPGVSSCWAVGGYGGSLTLPLALHYNGRSWTRVAIAAGPGAFGVNELISVDCPSTVDCWAVGISDSPGPRTQRLVEHWNGRAWSLRSSPDPDPGSTNYLNAVSCSSADSCWAVGNERATSPLVMHWNGAAWSLSSSPGGTTLSGVSCEWKTACFAVAALGGIVRLVGGVWRKVAPPAPSATTPQGLSAVSCSAPDSCWGVGARGAGAQASELPAAAFWDGTNWAAATVQAPTGVLASFVGVTCGAGGGCVAVGSYETSRVGNPFRFFADQTLANGPSS